MRRHCVGGRVDVKGTLGLTRQDQRPYPDRSAGSDDGIVPTEMRLSDDSAPGFQGDEPIVLTMVGGSEEEPPC